MTESLSIQQARKLVLLSQKLPPAKQSGRAVEATHSAIEHLGYIQIDTKLKLHINHLALEAIKCCCLLQIQNSKKAGGGLLKRWFLQFKELNSSEKRFL